MDLLLEGFLREGRSQHVARLCPPCCIVCCWLYTPQVMCHHALSVHVDFRAVFRYKSPGEAYVEGDASSASYFLAGATITGGTVTVEGCGSDSLQVRMTHSPAAGGGAAACSKVNPQCIQ